MHRLYPNGCVWLHEFSAPRMAEHTPIIFHPIDLVCATLHTQAQGSSVPIFGRVRQQAR